ncbi:hypothetical protein LEMLEM_LOCUS8081 [Lemmus lemmus]
MDENHLISRPYAIGMEAGLFLERSCPTPPH